jgi:hypothetical protein
MTQSLYVPARGQRIPMPGNQPDWPLDGQPINPIDLYHRRLVKDGDLIIKSGKAKKSAGEGGEA